jgi:protein phosphatase methylesterase 1
LSFSALAGVNDKYRIISFDYRGHGFNTKSQGEDLSGETLVKDTIQVLEFVAQKFPDETIIILGHSMGGSIATKTSAFIFKNQDAYSVLYEKIQGLIVIDVVEGTAMDALPYMESIVKSRPKSFKSLEEGIEYFYRSGTIKNTESARISVPSLLKFEDSTNRYIWKTNLLSSQKFWTGTFNI